MKKQKTYEEICGIIKEVQIILDRACVYSELFSQGLNLEHNEEKWKNYGHSYNYTLNSFLHQITLQILQIVANGNNHHCSLQYIRNYLNQTDCIEEIKKKSVSLENIENKIKKAKFKLKK